MWTENFQVYKLGLEEAKETEIKLPTFMEKGREFQKNIYFCFIDYCKNLDSVDHKKLWETIYNKNFYFPREIFPTYLAHSEAFVSISTLPAPLSN